jgi:hypothetical protein
LFRSAKQLVGGPNCFPALYAVNIFNGKVVSFKNNETFYEFINKADKPITRLDKAYLYLYLCKKVFQWGSFQVSALHEFPQETHHSSIFASNKSTQALFLKRYCFITHDGPDVSANGMTIFSSGNCDTGSLRYHFSFDEYDKLTAIAVDKIH